MVHRGELLGYELLQDKSGVGLYIDTGKQEENKRIYDSLQSHQTEVPHEWWTPS